MYLGNTSSLVLMNLLARSASAQEKKKLVKAKVWSIKELQGAKLLDGGLGVSPRFNFYPLPGKEGGKGDGSKAY